MNREKALVKNTIIISIGKICTSMVTFLLLPLYTTVLSTKEYGIVDLLNTLMSLLLPIVTLQIEKAVFRDLIEKRSNKKLTSEVITTGLIVVFVQSILFASIYLVISPIINSNYKLFLLTNVIAYIFVSLLQQISRGINETQKYSIGSFINATMTIIFNLVFLLIFKIGISGMLLGMLLGSLMTIIYYVFSLKIYKYISHRYFKFDLFKELLRYSIPLVPNALSWWIFNASDRVIVSTVLSVSESGILAASLKFSAIIATIYNIFDTSWIESISSSINDDDIQHYFNKIFNVILKVFITLSICMIAFMPIIFPIMINSNFSAGYNLVPISMISAIFNVMQGLIAVIYAAKKNTDSIARTSTVSAIINAIAHLILIKFVGLYAAVLSTLIAFVILGFYRLNDVSKKYFKIKIHEKILISFGPIVFIILLLYYINNSYLNILSMIITLLYSFWLNKDSLDILIKIFNNKIFRKGKVK